MNVSLQSCLGGLHASHSTKYIGPQNLTQGSSGYRSLPWASKRQHDMITHPYFQPSVILNQRPLAKQVLPILIMVCYYTLCK